MYYLQAIISSYNYLQPYIKAPWQLEVEVSSLQIVTPIMGVSTFMEDS